MASRPNVLTQPAPRRHGVGALAVDYWRSAEWWSASLLLCAVIGLNVSLILVNVLQNVVMGRMFTALQERDADAFGLAFGSLMALIVAYLLIAVLRVFLDQTLQLRWRRWLTDRCVTRWLASHSFYRMRFSSRVDNPDQRIADDVRLFIEQSMSLGIGLVNALLTLLMFSTLLWQLSGALVLTVGGVGIRLPGYMFWAAVAYSIAGSIVAHLVGRPLVRLHYRQQTAEADFRYELVRLRDEAEGVALSGGAGRERRRALDRFRALFDNFTKIIARNARYLVFQLTFTQLAYGVSILLAAPRYFAGEIQLGGIVQISNAFERVNEGLSWFVGSYAVIAEWRATMHRLREFLDETGCAEPAGARRVAGRDDAIELERLVVELPDGSPLLGPVTLRLAPGEAVLLRGPPDSGKSMLLRTIAGIWPYAWGEIRIPGDAAILFLPQLPYMPVGSLREAILYPGGDLRRGDAALLEALAAVDLARLGARLDEVGNWKLVLSANEQQRVAIARALLAAPQWLFVDEVTAGMAEAEESALLETIRRCLPQTTVVIVGNRASSLPPHGRILEIRPGPDGHNILGEAR